MLAKIYIPLAVGALVCAVGIFLRRRWARIGTILFNPWLAFLLFNATEVREGLGYVIGATGFAVMGALLYFDEGPRSNLEKNVTAERQ